MTIRICYVALRYPVLSETFVRDEVEALRRAGAQVVVVALEGGDIVEGHRADVDMSARRARNIRTIMRAARNLLRRPRSARVIARGPLTLGLRLKLAAFADEQRGVDHVHAHFAYRSADAAEVIAAAVGTRHSVTTHARDLFVPEGDLPRRLRAASRIVTVCEYNRRWLAEHLPEVADRVVVIPASVTLRELPRCRGSQGAVRLVAVGRLVEKKGFDVVLDACALLPRVWHLEIIGDGPCRAELEVRAAQLGIQPRTQFLGALDHAATSSRIASADVLCAAFRIASDGDRDSMPLVVKEAMAAAVPVVATDVVGVAEMVADGSTGFLVPPEDPAALATAISRLIDDPLLRREMGRKGRAVVEERFDIRDQVSRLIEEVFT